jgi:thiamine pyridinylase
MSKSTRADPLVMKSRFVLLLLLLATCLSTIAFAEQKQSRRILRAALYPYVPDKAGLFWKLEREFETAHPDIDLQYVDLSSNYYGGQLLDGLKGPNPVADVFEVDTVFLQDLVEQNLIQELPHNTSYRPSDFLPVASQATTLNSKVYGVPHWICGNFLFFRADDPEVEKFETLCTLDGLERLLGRPTADSDALLADLRGKSTLGEEYLDSVLDTFGDAQQALNHTDPNAPEMDAVKALSRLFLLTPGGLCDSDKHHKFGQFYARQFARRKTRAYMAYSEQLYYTVDETLHGIADGQPSVGGVHFDFDNTNGYTVRGDDDIKAIGAPLADSGSHMLAWVDVLVLRTGLEGQSREDALALIDYYNSEMFTLSVLLPQVGEAPRYLMPARASIFTNSVLLRAAPLYQTFLKVMSNATALTGPGLNDRLRAIGKKIENDGFSPRP